MDSNSEGVQAIRELRKEKNHCPQCDCLMYAIVPIRGSCRMELDKDGFPSNYIEMEETEPVTEVGYTKYCKACGYEEEVPCES